jgi:hypothetical protein
MGLMKQSLIVNKERWLLVDKLMNHILYGNHLDINVKNYQQGD